MRESKFIPREGAICQGDCLIKVFGERKENKIFHINFLMPM
jgi:hypothetical protein